MRCGRSLRAELRGTDDSCDLRLDAGADPPSFWRVTALISVRLQQRVWLPGSEPRRGKVLIGGLRAQAELTGCRSFWDDRRALGGHPILQQENVLESWEVQPPPPPRAASLSGIMIVVVLQRWRRLRVWPSETTLVRAVQDDNVTDEKVGPGFMLQLLSSYARKTPQKWKNSAEGRHQPTTREREEFWRGRDGHLENERREWMRAHAAALGGHSGTRN